MTRAAVFDLFETLVDYDEQKSLEFSTAAAELLGRPVEQFHPLWRAGRPARDSGPLRPYLASIGIEGDPADRLVELRRASSLGLLETPRPGVLETLADLRSRGIGLGLITVCSEDVVDVWDRTPFAGQFDSVVYSCSCGYRKPDPRLYMRVCEELRVAPAEALYVGDGTNDELAGAEAVGMRAVQIGSTQPWDGERIAAIPEVLALL
ncbi:MAG TPA: HAD-IA family hydrolase [Gaiellaceae bacterium]|nr:HAD-IA family hydrolase [Gaiellaceae bacterium]